MLGIPDVLATIQDVFPAVTNVLPDIAPVFAAVVDILGRGVVVLVEVLCRPRMVLEEPLVGLRVGFLEMPKALPHVGLLLLHHLAELLGVFLFELMKPLPFFLKLFASALVLCGLRRERAGQHHQGRHHHPKRQRLHRFSLLG
jgi:hypothetical protein